MTAFPSLVKGARLKIVCFTLRGFESRRCHARLAQLVERKTFNLVVGGSSPSCDKSPLFTKVSASGECVGVTLSNYSPVAT